MPINNITFNSFFDVLYFTKKNDIPFYYSDELFNKYSGEDNKQYLIKGSSKVKDFIKNNNLSYMSNLDLNYCGEKKCFDCMIIIFIRALNLDKSKMLDLKLMEILNRL